MRLAVYLWADTGESPIELLRYQLRMLYGVTPEQLNRNTGADLLEMLRDLMIDGFIKDIQRKKTTGGLKHNTSNN